MRKQLSIVLVEGDHVPRELSALLVGMGVWVKSTWSTGLAAALSQTTPHLIVCGDPSQLPLLKRTISEMHPGIPLLLIADWDLGRAGRAVSGGLVEDFIPESLPAVDIARRLETLAGRRALRSPSRSTLTPPTRAGMHPLLAVEAGRDDRTPESRQDHPAPSRRPPPPPVRVMSQAPSWRPPATPTATQSIPSAPPLPSLGYSIPPVARVASKPPPPPVRSARPAAPYSGPQYSGPPYSGQAYSGPARPGAAYSMPPHSVAPHSVAPHSVAPRSVAAHSVAPSSMAPHSMAPRSGPPYSAAPYSLSPDSAPPIQMLTTTTTTRRSRRRGSGPGFTLGAALGVAASAGAFVGVIEFEQDLRVLAQESAARVGQLIDRSGTELPGWLARFGEPSGMMAASAPGALASAIPPSASPPLATATPASATGAAALELSDLGAIETDSALGMSHAEAEALFKIEDKRLPSCDQLLADWEPPLPMIEEDRPKHGALHRRQAQEHLVAGEHQRALKDLCKSARIDPTGPGTESLASVYLSLRSLGHAEFWVQRYLEANPRSDSARDLLGDVENQRGRVAIARGLWLDVLGVESDATGLLREVAKHWIQDATSALAARDLAQAERKLRRALTLDPTNESAATVLSHVLERQGETLASSAWAKRAREL